MIPIWPELESPRAYAHKAAIHNFIKARARGTPRVAKRLVERGIVCQEGLEDTRLTTREEWEWVECVLSFLSPKLKEVMRCKVGGLSHKEGIAELGISPEVFRRRLCDAKLVQILNDDGEFKQSDGNSGEEDP